MHRFNACTGSWEQPARQLPDRHTTIYGLTQKQTASSEDKKNITLPKIGDLGWIFIPNKFPPKSFLLEHHFVISDIRYDHWLERIWRISFLSSGSSSVGDTYSQITCRAEFLTITIWHMSERPWSFGVCPDRCVESVWPYTHMTVFRTWHVFLQFISCAYVCLSHSKQCARLSNHKHGTFEHELSHHITQKTEITDVTMRVLITLQNKSYIFSLGG